MKKLMAIAVASLAMVSASYADVTWAAPAGGVTGGINSPMDKLGAHQNGGRGCVGCHAPHSGARGNGGTLQWDSATSTYVSAAVVGESGDETLWGQDIGPVLGMGIVTTAGGFTFDPTDSTPKIKTGIVYCLSCHDGNVAKGAMMTNQSFEQAAGLLPATYGTQPIPTLLGADGGTNGNYANDHPLGRQANVAKLGMKGYVELNATKTKLQLKAAPADAKYTQFQASYGLPIITGRANFAVETSMTTSDEAFVVCTTCHTPHSMYTTSASSSNPVAGLTTGTFPTYFFISAPYNPGADTALGAKASSATQFCRQCHFTGAGGSNEGSGITNILTAF